MSSSVSPGSYYSSGLLEELCEENRKKLLADPENVSLRSNLAKALARLGNFHDAIREFKLCIDKNPSPENWNDLGKALLSAGDYEDSIHAFEEVVNRGCQWPDAFFHMALSCRGKGDLEESDKFLRQAISINPKYREALNERGEILELLGRKDEALLEFKKVIALFFAEYQFHEDVDYKYDLSVLFDNSDLVEETIKRLKQVVQRNPGFADVHYKLGQALEAKGLKNEALLSFRKALEINPRFDTARKHFWKRA